MEDSEIARQRHNTIRGELLALDELKKQKDQVDAIYQKMSQRFDQDYYRGRSVLDNLLDGDPT